MSPKVPETSWARPGAAKTRTNVCRRLWSLAGRRSDGVASGRPQSGASVRRNPKDSVLEKLRGRQSSDPLVFYPDSGPRWHEDAVPDGTRGAVPDGTKGFTGYPQRGGCVGRD